MKPSNQLVVRAGTPADIDALYKLALLTGGGFTNLPPDREGLAKRLQLSHDSMQADIQTPGGELYLLVMEDTATGEVIGTASLFSKLASEWPFYSFRITKINQTSKELSKTLSSDVLHLVNDFDGCSEVGGLFLDAARRQSGAGRLLARCRYLFIAQARKRFSERVMADLRGYQDDNGQSPFWEGLGRHFFDMDFADADQFNGLHGNQFIADLMPKYPIYTRMLPAPAQAAIGKPHREGLGALNLLTHEGFRADGYVDIFDGGPSVHAIIDDLRGVKNSKISRVEGVAENDKTEISMIACGSAVHFRACMGVVVSHGDGCRLTPASAKLLGLTIGDTIRHAPL